MNNINNENKKRLDQSQLIKNKSVSSLSLMREVMTMTSPLFKTLKKK